MVNVSRGYFYSLHVLIFLPITPLSPARLQPHMSEVSILANLIALLFTILHKNSHLK